MLEEKMVEILLNADGKALATGGGELLHVVPVSSIKVIDNKIHLVNYFFGQTLQNILSNPEVSLAAWRGLEGYQIKATAEHITEGEVFEEIVNWIGEILPDRVVRGVLILTPHTVHDVSAHPDRAGRKIASNKSSNETCEQ